MQAESQAKFVKCDKKAIAIPEREKINNQLVWIWKERENVQFYFPLLTGLRR